MTSNGADGTPLLEAAGVSKGLRRGRRYARRQIVHAVDKVS
jgi:hypothetical protein